MYINQAELKSNRGFMRGATLIEVLVAIAIISIALGPAMYGAISSVKVSSSIRDNLTASYLAQEGVEVVRALRDANWFSGLAFNDGLADGSYQIEWDSLVLRPNAGSFLQIDASGLYRYRVGGTPTIFKRRIDIDNISADQIRVTSTVDWVDRRGESKSITVESHLFNWK